MRKDLTEALKRVDISGWVEISCEYGPEELRVRVPPDFREITMREARALDDPRGEIERALENPIGTGRLEELVRSAGKSPGDLRVAITVSDITRPVPYRGEEGILKPILGRLEREGVRRENITIVVGNGTHRPSTEDEKIRMFGDDILSGGYAIVDHDCRDGGMMVEVGYTESGTLVYVNRYFAQADLKIATGLVESHFMAGVSGGGKAICPGLVDLKTIQKFHGPEFLESPYATNLVLENNPCYKEASEVARKVGVDFLVNVTLNKDMRLTGVFAGDLIKAHRAAVEKIKTYVEVPIEEESDIVLTHGGYVGINHYQTAKAAVGAIPAVKEKGIMIIAASNRDVEPIGSLEYRTLTHLLKLQGPDGYVSVISHPGWKFVKDQWEPEVWARALRKVGEEGLIYCTKEIRGEDFAFIPGTAGYEFLTPGEEGLQGIDAVRSMVQNAVIWAVYRGKKRGVEPTLAFIREGPYAVPRLMKSTS